MSPNQAFIDALREYLGLKPLYEGAPGLVQEVEDDEARSRRQRERMARELTRRQSS